MQRLLTCLLITAVMMVSIACSQGDPGLAYTGPGVRAELDTLPELQRLASATEIVDGVDYLAKSPGTTEAPPALEFDAGGLACAWALYGYGLPAGLTLDSLAVDVESVTGSYWVGLSDYATTNTWEFHGPYTDDCLITLDANPADYLSPTDNFHWVVVADAGTSLSLTGSTVETTGTPVELEFRVPPAGKHTIFAGPASAPYVFLMDSASGTAEDGAPVILYTADNEGVPDTYIATYNGIAWENRLLSADKQLTHPQGYWAGETGKIFAYYHGAGGMDHSGFLEINMDADLNIVSSNLSGTYDRYPDRVDFVCRPEVDSYALIYACNTVTEMIRIDWCCRGYYGSYGDLYMPDSFDVVDVDIILSPDASSGWAMYVFSQPDADQKVHNLSHIRPVEFDGEVWSYMPSDHIAHDEIVGLDLHYNAEGEAELLMVCARDYQLTVPPELDFTTMLYQDVSLGTYDVNHWEFTTLWEGTIDETGIASGELGPDIGIDAAWAGDDLLCCTTGAGTVAFTEDPEFQYTGGTLTTTGGCLGRSEGVFEPSTYFAEAPGVCYTWVEGPAGPACAYLEAAAIEFSEVATCEVPLAEGAVVYWSP